MTAGRSARPEASRFSGRAILVTGAAGGLGLEIARRLLDEGATVYSGARAAAAEPVGTRFLKLDVTDEAAWSEAIDRVVAECGAIHGLVNCAGRMTSGTDFVDVTLDAWRAEMAVNLDGAFIGCRTAVRAMARSGGGAIVNISSSLAHVAVPEAAAYCVSKAALLALTRLAAKAAARHGVRVSALLAGAIDTPMLWRHLPDGGDRAAFARMLNSLSPLGRIAQPQEIARAVAFLLDPASDFVTGALLAIDGGQLVD